MIDAQRAAKNYRRVLKGSIPLQTYDNRIQLFDGLFTTGFRVVEFRIIPLTPTNQEEVLSLLSTENQGAVPSTFDFANNEHVAYAAWGAPNQAYYSDWNLVIEGNMIVEDLWLSAYTTGDDTHLNYYIVLDKYKFSDWNGALTMVRNKSQGAD